MLKESPRDLSNPWLIEHWNFPPAQVNQWMHQQLTRRPAGSSVAHLQHAHFTHMMVSCATHLQHARGSYPAVEIEICLETKLQIAGRQFAVIFASCNCGTDISNSTLLQLMSAASEHVVTQPVESFSPNPARCADLEPIWACKTVNCQQVRM